MQGGGSVPTIQVQLMISQKELLRWYSGDAKDVSAIAMDGRRVRFPVKVLQQFVGHSGIQGIFEIEFTQAGRFSGIRKVV